jgi:hypothetical protein
LKKTLTNIKLISIVGTLILVQLLGYLSINVFGDYGWSVFFFIPFIIGFLPAYISGNKIDIKKSTAYKLGFITLGLAVLALLIFAIEGLICVLMASPLLLLAVWLGSYLGFKSSNSNYTNPKNTTIILLFLSLGFMSFDYVNKPKDLIPVRTKIIVNAPIEKVWTNVVTFDKINEPIDWIFKTGISYPTNATIVGQGVGAIRYCNFTTGSFVEPITTWNEPNLLQFDVREQPIPMNELNPFWEVHPPHLDGYFKSYKGQFKLTKINDNQTELEGTTWYKVDINPELYWKAWSDFIVHRIHKRVLNHIKKGSELN